MQWRAFGSRLFERNPAFRSFRGVASQMVHCPEPNMPTLVGPPAFSASFHFAAMTSKASFHETGVNSPFLS